MKPETKAQREVIAALRAYPNVDVIRIEPGMGATFGLPDTIVYFADDTRLHIEFKCVGKRQVAFKPNATAHDKLRNSQKRTFPVLAKHKETILVIEALPIIGGMFTYEILSFNDPTVKAHCHDGHSVAAWVMNHFCNA